MHEQSACEREVVPKGLEAGNRQALGLVPVPHEADDNSSDKNVSESEGLGREAALSRGTVARSR